VHLCVKLLQLNIERLNFPKLFLELNHLLFFQFA